MTSKLACWFLSVALAALVVGCKKEYSNYCDEPDTTHNCMDLIDADTSCASNAECAAPTPICDVMGSKMCVQCIAPDQIGACSGMTPACGTDNTCRACEAHGECASAACLPDGSCASETDVAYVAPAGTGTACTKAAPCGTLANAVAASKPYVKIAIGTIKDTQTTTIDGKRVTVLAESGAKLDRDGDGPILEVRSANADVSIYDLEITGASGMTGADGIVITPNGGMPKVSLTRVKVTSNQGIGITASGGLLTATRSFIAGNTGGGISLSAAHFDISNTIIVGNGGPATGFGGVRLDQTSAGTRRFEFNTVSNNSGAAGTATGVVCTLVTQAVTFSNNIVYDNQVGSGRTQVAGSNCNWTYSDIGPDTVTGNGNINMNPMFANPSQNDFHIAVNSPCRDVADPGATLALDYDGDARPVGPRRDMGADEAK